MGQSYILVNYSIDGSQWMIAQMAERMLCTWRTRVQIPTLAPYEITL